MESRYKLTKTEVSKGWLYQVIDIRDGRVVKTRRSRRNYVAAAVFDNYFYGRRDLVRTGDRMREIWEYRKAFDRSTEDEDRARCRERIAQLETIAYLEE